MIGQGGEAVQQPGPVAPAFAHPDDAAAAYRHAFGPNRRKGVQPVGVGAGGDHGAVVLRPGVQVVVVVVEPGGLQGLGLRRAQHAEGGAGLQAQRLHPGDHRLQLRQVTVLQLPPGRAHAEPLCARSLGPGRLGHHRLRIHQLAGLQAGVEMGGLAAVAAVLGAAAGLHRQQLRQLHLGGIEPSAVDLGGAEHQLGERQLEQRLDLLEGPVVPGRRRVGKAGGGVHAGLRGCA